MPSQDNIQPAANKPTCLVHHERCVKNSDSWNEKFGENMPEDGVLEKHVWGI